MGGGHHTAFSFKENVICTVFKIKANIPQFAVVKYSLGAIKKKKKKVLMVFFVFRTRLFAFVSLSYCIEDIDIHFYIFLFNTLHYSELKFLPISEHCASVHMTWNLFFMSSRPSIK